jgi:hypothetical protein
MIFLQWSLTSGTKNRQSVTWVRISFSACTNKISETKKPKLKISKGEEGPKYYINSYASIPKDPKTTLIPAGIDYDACHFGENMNVNYQGTEIQKILHNERCTASP